MAAVDIVTFCKTSLPTMLLVAIKNHGFMVSTSGVMVQVS